MCSRKNKSRGKGGLGDRRHREYRQIRENRIADNFGRGGVEAGRGVCPLRKGPTEGHLRDPGGSSRITNGHVSERRSSIGDSDSERSSGSMESAILQRYKDSLYLLVSKRILGYRGILTEKDEEQHYARWIEPECFDYNFVKTSVVFECVWYSKAYKKELVVERGSS